MAKKVKTYTGQLLVDRILLVGVLLAATSYIVRGTLMSAFLEASAVVIGVIWSYRALTTNPDKKFRLLATLVLVLLGSLLAFYLAAAHGNL
jgi:hypothetical protein